MAADEMGRDPRRFFHRREVRRVWMRQGQVCARCNREIPFDLMQGDHIVPWIDGGETEVSNCQALCGSCNLRKGRSHSESSSPAALPRSVRAGHAELRQWQVEALRACAYRIETAPVLVEATPGAGKTLFGLTLAYQLMQSGVVNRLFVVTPTRSVADEWLAAASPSNDQNPTIPLRSTTDWRPVDPIDLTALRGGASTSAGAVITYQALFALPEVFLAHAAEPGYRTMVIFDEVHHCGAVRAWGRAAQVSFSASTAAILSLSGTPFRTAGDPIAFVPYEGALPAPTYIYDYRSALADNVCRTVQFVEGRGTSTFRDPDGHPVTVSFDDETKSPHAERSRYRAAIEWVEDGGIADRLLRDANDYVLELRRNGDDDAAALVVAADCAHADSIATQLSRINGGRRPVVACSKLFDPSDPIPAEAIADFKSGFAPWLVSVNMVSEGIDIRRLRVVVYLTNRLTTLSFRQIVGRVVRSDTTNRPDNARVYLPADPRLVGMARRILDEVDELPRPIIVPAETETRYARSRSSESTTISSRATQGTAFDIEGGEAKADLIEASRRFIAEQGLRSTDPASLALLASENAELREHILKRRKSE